MSIDIQPRINITRFSSIHIPVHQFIQGSVDPFNFAAERITEATMLLAESKAAAALPRR